MSPRKFLTFGARVPFRLSRESEVAEHDEFRGLLQYH